MTTESILARCRSTHSLSACGPKVAPVAPGADRSVYEIGDEGIELLSLVVEVKPEYTTAAGRANCR